MSAGVDSFAFVFGEPRWGAVQPVRATERSPTVMTAGAGANIAVHILRAMFMILFSDLAMRPVRGLDTL